MPRTPPGGRLPRGPRIARRARVLAVPAALAVTLVAAGGCSTPPAATAPAGAAAAPQRSATPPAPAPSRAPGVPPATAASPPRAVSQVPRPVPATAAPRGRTPAGATRHVTGTVVRLSVEGGGTRGAPRTASVATYLQTADGPQLVGGEALDDVSTGSRVEAELGNPGSTADGTTDTSGAVAPPVAAARVVETPPPPRPLTTAVHAVTTVLVLPPGATPDGTTSAALSAAVDGPVDRFWSAQTDGRVRFRVTRAVGWTRVRSRCDDAWSLWAEVTRRVGFVPGPRRHLLVLVPAAVPGCYAGLGTIGAAPSAGGLAYVRGTLTGLVAHELGHNLGLGHSNGLQCDGASDGDFTGGAWSGGCVAEGYRDWYDVMGMSWERLGTLSTAQAYQLGALDGRAVATVTGPVHATLTALGERAGLRSLRVVLDGTTYVVEYRAAVGADGWLGTDWRGLAPGVLVRRSDPAGGGQTLLLDATPSPSAGFATDWSEPVPPGATLTAAGGRLVVRVEAETATTADVSVEVDGVRAASGLARLGARLAGARSSRVVRVPLAATGDQAAPGDHDRSPVRMPAR